MKKTRKFVSIFAILFALVFTLSVCFFAACGNKDDDEKDNDTTTGQDENQGGTTVNHEHNYVVDDTTWAFSDDYSECTATAKCTATEGTCDAPTKTVDATVTPNPVNATCTTAGTVTYVATYEGKTVKTSETMTTDAALGHDVTATWNETTSDWDYTCSRNDTIADGDTLASTTYMAGTEAALASALGEGGTVKLTENIVGTFTASADTTLDLAGYSITYSGPQTYDGYGESYGTAYTIVVKESASLTIVDGSETDDTAGTGSIVFDYSVSSPWNDMRYSPRFAAIQSEGTLIVNGGSIVSTSVGIVAEGNETYEADGTTVAGGYLYFHGGSIEADQYSIFEGAGTNVVVYIDGGTVSGGRGVCVDGDAYFGYEYIAQSGSTSRTQVWQDNAKTTLNVYEGATVVSEGRSAISTLGYANADSTYVNIYGGTIKGEDLSTLGKEDSSLSSTSDFGTVYIANGNLKVSGEPEITGTYALSIKGGTSVISGGTFTSTGMGEGNFTDAGTKPAAYALSVVYYGPEPQGNSVSGRTDVDNTLDVTVSGGTFTGAIVFDDSAATTEKTAAFTITGGTFSEDVEGEYLDVTQYHTELQSSGMYKVASGVAGRNVDGMITADAYVASQPGMIDGTTLDATEKTLMSGDDETSVSFYGDTASTPGAKISRKNRTSTDGYLFTFAIQIKKASVESDSLSNCVKVTVTEACTVTVYVMSNKSDSGETRVLGTWTESEGSYTQDATTYAVGEDANANFVPITISFAAAGTYLIGATDNTINFYGLTINYTVA